MGINKRNTSGISIAGRGISKSVTGIASAHKKTAQALQRDEEEERIPMGQARGPDVSLNNIMNLTDPKIFLNKKDQKKWDKMSPQRREKIVQKEVAKAYSRQKMKILQAGLREEEVLKTCINGKKVTGIASQSAIKKNRPINFSELQKNSIYDENQAAYSVENDTGHSRAHKRNPDTNQNFASNHPNAIAFTGSSATGANYASSNAESAAKIMGNTARKSIEKSGMIVKNTVGGAATMGAQTAMMAAQRTADKFKNTLEQSVVKSSEQMAMTLQENASKNKVSFVEKLPDMVAKPVAVIIAVLAKGLSGFASGIVSTLAVFAVITSLITIVGTVLFLFISTILGGGTSSTGNGQAMIRVARQELSVSDQNVGGQKYKEFMGMDADWCAMFLSWAAEQCGYIESNILPKNASVSGWMSFFQGRNQYHEKQGYTPQAGDIVIFKNGMSHIGIVVEANDTTITTIEGNSGVSVTNPYHRGSRVTENTYPLSYAAISGYGKPAYPNNGDYGNSGAPELDVTEGTEIMIPSGLGNIHTYMGWSLCSAQNSDQYRLRMDSGEPYDEEGFGRIGNRYVIACTTTYGTVGDYVDFYQSDGTIIPCIIGDIKNQTDPGCNQWGHMNGVCVIEFCVSYEMWYHPFHANPGTESCHPEWNQTIVKAVNRGSYWGS